MDEFEFIKECLNPLATDPKSLSLCDDIALLQESNMAFSTDMICEKVHFLENTDPYNLAQKLLRVNISDLVAKAIRAKYYSLNLFKSPKNIYSVVKRFCLRSKRYSRRI